MLPDFYGPQPDDSTDWSLKKINALLWRMVGGPPPGSSGSGGIASQGSTPGTPSIKTSDGTVLVANPNRKSFLIQNLDDAAVYVRLGADASASVFDFELQACTAANDGTSPAVQWIGYTGIVSVLAASGSPRVNVNEYT